VLERCVAITYMCYSEMPQLLVYMHACMNTYKYARIYVCTCVCACVLCVCAYLGVCLGRCVCVGVRVDLYMFWYIYMYLCLYVYISACKNARMFEQIKHPAKRLDYSLWNDKSNIIQSRHMCVWMYAKCMRMDICKMLCVCKSGCTLFVQLVRWTWGVSCMRYLLTIRVFA